MKTIRAAARRRVITWNGDQGTAPDGSSYVLDVEGGRGEGRMWSALHYPGPMLPPVLIAPVHQTGWPTKDRAIQDAEAHYRKTREDQDR